MATGSPNEPLLIVLSVTLVKRVLNSIDSQLEGGWAIVPASWGLKVMGGVSGGARSQ